MQAHTLLLLATGILSLIACALTITVVVLRAKVNEKADEVAVARSRISDLQQALDKSKARTAEAPKKPLLKPTPLLWMNNHLPGSAQADIPVRTSISTDISSPEHETKYKGLYCKLDEHIQKFSGTANQCLTTLADNLRHTDISSEIKASLADLAVQLKRLNPLLNTDNINLTIFGQFKEIVEESNPIDSNAQGLRNVIIQQRGIILDLKEKLSKMEGVDTKKYEEQLESLEKLLAESETCIKTLEKELLAANSQLEVKQTQIERTRFLQTQVHELELKEKNMAMEILELKNECVKSTTSPEKEHEFNEKMMGLKNEILEKEKQLEKFKAQESVVENEYLRLFENYQHLLNTYNVKEGDDVATSGLSTEQILELEEVKAILKSKEFELDRTKSECQLLESSYLDMVTNTEALENTKNELDRLRIENAIIGNQLEQAMKAKASTNNMAQELDALKEKYNQLKHQWDLNQGEMKRLRKKEDELVRLRVEYRIMEEQFLTVATAAVR